MELRVRLGEKGRITIPAPIRKALNLREGDILKVSVKNRSIILKPEKIVTSKEIKGILDITKVDIEEIEEALGRNLS